MREGDRELQKLMQAVEDFAAEMKRRLRAKHEAGYTGWSIHRPAVGFAEAIVRDGMYAEALLRDTGKSDGYMEVDMANRAVMLWYQRQQPVTVIDEVDLREVSLMPDGTFEVGGRIERSHVEGKEPT